MSKETNATTTKINDVIVNDIEQWFNVKVKGENARSAVKVGLHALTLKNMELDKMFLNGDITTDERNTSLTDNREQYKKLLADYETLKESATFAASEQLKTFRKRLNLGGIKVKETKDGKTTYTTTLYSVEDLFNMFIDGINEVSPSGFFSTLTKDELTVLNIAMCNNITMFLNNVREITGTELVNDLNDGATLENVTSSNIGDIDYIRSRKINDKNIIACLLQAMKSIAKKPDIHVETWSEDTREFFVREITKLGKDVSRSEYNKALASLTTTPEF